MHGQEPLYNIQTNGRCCHQGRRTDSIPASDTKVPTTILRQHAEELRATAYWSASIAGPAKRVSNFQAASPRGRPPALRWNWDAPSIISRTRTTRSYFRGPEALSLDGSRRQAGKEVSGDLYPPARSQQASPNGKEIWPNRTRSRRNISTAFLRRTHHQRHRRESPR